MILSPGDEKGETIHPHIWGQLCNATCGPDVSWIDDVGQKVGRATFAISLSLNNYQKKIDIQEQCTSFKVPKSSSQKPGEHKFEL